MPMYFCVGKSIFKKILSFLLIITILLTSRTYFKPKIVYADNLSVLVKATNVNIRSGPGSNHSALGRVSAGYRINVIGSTKDSQGKTWYKFLYNNKTAYIRSDFVKQSATYVHDQNFENHLSSQGFPEDYKVLLRQLHADYPNFVFNKKQINMDFNYAVDQEMVGVRTLVTKGAISSYKSTDVGKYDWTTSTWPTFDGNSWVAASREVVAYYMDPRNALYDPYIYQFEEQKYNSNFQTIQGVAEMVKGTFLDKRINTQEIASNSTNGTIPIITQDNTNSNNNVIVPNNTNPTNTNNASYIPSQGPGMDNFSTSNAQSGIANQVGPGVIDYSGLAIPILSNVNDDEVVAFTNSRIIVMPLTDIDGSLGTSNSIIDETSNYQFTYLPAGNYSYAEIIYNACAQIGINPYVAVAMILQEQGVDGKSDSISGNNKKFPGIYNFGNIGSYANQSAGLSPVENGLLFASTEGSYNRPWNSPEKAIYGVVDYYANSFINKGQDTFYLKKWNVQGNEPFTHQYMTNVLGAANEAVFLSQAYDDVMKNSVHEFSIVCYNNMPQEIAPLPTKDGNPNNRLKSLSVDGYVLTPTFDTNTLNYTLVLPQNVSTIKVSAVPFDSKASVTGKGNVDIVVSNTIVNVNVIAQNGDIRQYSIYVYRPGLENTTYNPNELVIPIIGNQDNIITAPNIINNNQSGVFQAPPIINSTLVTGGPGM